MINLALATNYNLKTDILRDSEEEKVIELSYHPMLDMFLDLGIKSNHFPVGLTLETLARYHPDVISKVKALASKGCVEVGSHTYTHPIVPITPNADIIKQVEYDLELHEKIIGVKPKGFYPPEFTYDATLPLILNKFGLEWIMLLNNNVVGTYGSEMRDTFKIGKVHGIENSELPCVFVYGDDKLELKTKIFKTFEGDLKPEEFTRYFFDKLKTDGGIFDDTFVLLYFDIETPYLAMSSQNTKPVEKMHKALEEIYAKDDIKSVTISEFVKNASPDRKTYTPLPFVTFKPLSMWTEGSEKLDVLLNESRQKISLAETYCGPSDSRLANAWRYLMLAEGSDARIAVSKRRQQIGVKLPAGKRYGNFSRVLENYEMALKAKEEAERIISERSKY